MNADPIPGNDPTPWQVLHDGEIVRLQRRGETLSVWVDIPYLRDRFEPPGTGFRLDLAGCAHARLSVCEGPWIDDLEAMTAAEPEILSAAADGDEIVLYGGTTVVRLRYATLALGLEDGTPVTLQALIEAATAYWDAFAASGEA